MLDRKESLLRILKLQHEQLEQWEHKRSLFNDPDEKMRCENKITNIKTLIKENEDELKKFKGGKATQGTSDTILPGVKHMEYNEIGFNSHTHFSENNDPGNIEDKNPVSKIGDEIDPAEIMISNPIIASIHSTGNSVPEDFGNSQMQEISSSAQTSKKKNNPTWQFKYSPQLVISLLLSIGVYILMQVFKGEDHFNFKEQAPQLLGLILSIIAMCVLYWHPHFTIQNGLKFAISIIILCIYAGPFFWHVILFGKEVTENEKPAGEVIFLPLLIITIGSMLLLINEENKERNKAK